MYRVTSRKFHAIVGWQWPLHTCTCIHVPKSLSLTCIRIVCSATNCNNEVTANTFVLSLTFAGPGSEDGEGKGAENGEGSTSVEVPDYKTQQQEIRAVLHQRLKKGDTW